jgi:hypothetical protein
VYHHHHHPDGEKFPQFSGNSMYMIKSDVWTDCSFPAFTYIV